MTGGIDIDALKAALAVAEAKASDAEAEIAFLRLTIEKLRRELYGWRSERKSRLLDQLELQLDELEASATEDELAAERVAAMYTLIGTAKLNNVDPQAWLADVLGKIAGTPQSQLDELLPWNWQDNRRHDRAA